MGDQIRIKRVTIIVAITMIVLLSLGYLRFGIYAGFFEQNPSVTEDGIYMEEVASGLGNPTCLTWISSDWLLVCDTESDSILSLQYSDGNLSEPYTLISNLDNPHGVLLWQNSNKSINRIFVSQAGKLEAWNISDGTSPSDWIIGERTSIIEGVAKGNHQQNAIIQGPNNTIYWHSGSTCNVCDELDNRSATIMEVDPYSGDYSIIATGVRNSFDGTWVPNVGYVFTDNGHDWSGDFPPEEINLLQIGGNYGWPDISEDVPVPEGSIPPIGTYDAHSSVNGIDVRPSNSTLPGGNYTLYATVFGSWNTIVPVGKQIIRIDLIEDPSQPQGWSSEISVIVEDLSSPLPIKFHPNGDLYFAEYSHGTLYRIHS